MYFHERDQLSTHTLVAAAYQILRDLHGPGLFERTLDQYLEPEDAKAVLDGIRDSQNFLKHADRDPNRILEFNPADTEYLLRESAFIYVEHVDPTPKLTANIKAYENWFVVRHPEIATKHPDLRPMVGMAKRAGIDKLSRREFYQQSVEAYRQAHGPS